MVMGGRSIDVPRPANRREPMQSVTKLLLLAMFAFGARYAPDEFADGGDKARAGDQFATDARRLLSEYCNAQQSLER